MNVILNPAKHVIESSCPHCSQKITVQIATLGGRPSTEMLRREKSHAVDACRNPLCRKPVYIRPMNMVWNR